MSFSGNLPPPPTVDAAELTAHRPPAHLVSHAVPAVTMRQTFSYRKRILQIEPGRLQLRLVSDPQIAVDSISMDCEVVGWGLTMPSSQAEEIPRAMARRFLELFSKADAGALDQQDEAYWVGILDQVDFQTFCIDRAAPHYMEGSIVSKQPNQTRVEWHDGERQNIGSKVARALGCLEVGDEFGAFVKLGRDNEVLSIENLTIISSVPA